MKKLIWFGSGLGVGLSILSIAKASVPKTEGFREESILLQQVSELHVKKEAQLDLDSSLTPLSQQEKKFKENLPLSQHPFLSEALKRIQNTPKTGTKKN
ncbi:MAG: hypothetical protein ACO3A2_06125 [Bdellovibrionia bacterium]